MRLWTLHPRDLDPVGLVALWREALLAQQVLLGATKGYTRHPQLDRFRETQDPLATIASYLLAIAAEAASRRYRFNSTLIATAPGTERVNATTGQLALEGQHLQAKLQLRNPALASSLRESLPPEAHPLFIVSPGPAASWERRLQRW